jgi:hypothetical protein
VPAECRNTARHFAAGVPRRVLERSSIGPSHEGTIQAALATDVCEPAQLSKRATAATRCGRRCSEPDYALLDDLERLIREKRLTGS